MSTVLMFVFQLAINYKLKYSFPDPNALEQHNRQCKIIENFERDYLGTNLFPKYLIKFARCLRLAYNDYETLNMIIIIKTPKSK